MNKYASGTSWLCPDLIFDGKRLLAGQALGIQSGVTTQITPAENLGPDISRRSIKGIVSPGFVDLQVNGGGGHLLNADPTPENMSAIAKAHHRFGTIAILPTVITDAPEVLGRAVDAALDARDQTGISGLHIEGPHISGPRRGTHDESYICPLGTETLNYARRIRDAGIPLMLTLAPEAATDRQISQLAEMGVVVSLGHSDVSADRAETAFTAGARAVTHLFNAMSPMENRAPGLTGAAINSHAYTGIICDGVHVDDRMVGLAFRARPVKDRMFLVSDAMPTVGGPDTFRLYGKDIQRVGNRLVNAEGSLAGAHTTMSMGLARLVSHVGIDRETALRAAIQVPSQLMGLDLDQIVGRKMSDLIVLDERCNYQGSLAQEIG